MGRQKTPTAVLEARGAFKKNPDRRRDAEPEVKTPLGPAPDYFSDDQREAYNGLRERAPIGVLTSADQDSVEQCAILLAKMRRAEKVWKEIDDYIARDDFEDPDGARRIAEQMGAFRRAFGSGDHGQLRSLLAQFGMTPSGRAGLSIKNPDESHGEFDDL